VSGEDVRFAVVDERSGFMIRVIRIVPTLDEEQGFLDLGFVRIEIIDTKTSEAFFFDIKTELATLLAREIENCTADNWEIYRSWLTYTYGFKNNIDTTTRREVN